MIYAENKRFILSTAHTSYAFCVNDEGLLEHLHYGALIAPSGDTEDFFKAIKEKVSHNKGTTIAYKKDSLTILEDMMLEVSSVGKGDLREPLIELVYEDGSRTSDFVFEEYMTVEDPDSYKTLPCSVWDDDTRCLRIVLKERVKPIKIVVDYIVFESSDVISRRTAIINEGEEPVRILRLLSNQVDFDDCGYRITSFGGNWGREMDRFDTVLNTGKFVVSSRAGVSSNRNNPFIMMTAPDTSETHGDAYGFNLIYSGNHYEAFEVSGFYKTRFVAGINPEGFDWVLNKGDTFEAPEAVMSYSGEGLRGLSHNMHDFVRNHVVRGKYKDKPRTILLNSWEAAYFNVNASRIVSLAAKAKEAGAELLVMDDGWFKGRNGETSSLGDWTPDKKKIPAGLEALADRVHEAGIDFGIWVEPEMINEDSDLYRAHPEYAMTIPGRENSLGRNQMLLDLTNPEVVDYVKDSMRNIFKTPGLNYVKWDMNRMFSDVYSKVLPKERQGETLHRYYIGLYDILKTLTEEFPDILFEGCASGGNRTDLGILSYMPQIWGSDDTDAIERTRIQTGLSYGYPMSSITSHVSACPNHQTLRNTPMDTRFNVAAFGVLGYELNLSDISGEEFELVKEQIALYKEWRDVFFGGDFYRLSGQSWMVVSKDKKRAAAIIWKELCRPNDFYLKLKTAGLDPDREYHVYNIAKKYNIKLFGDLINQMAPIHIKKDSLIHNTLAHFIKLDSEKEDYTISGQVLNNAGIKLSQAFGGTGIGGETRLFQDFYSRMYFMEAKDR